MTEYIIAQILPKIYDFPELFVRWFKLEQTPQLGDSWGVNVICDNYKVERGLFQDLILADDRQFLCTAIDGIDNADDSKYGEKNADKTDNAYDKAETPGDCIDDRAEDAVGNTIDHRCDQQDQALVAVIPGKFGILCCQYGDQHQRAEVCQDRHTLVLVDVRFIKFRSGIGSIVQRCHLCAKVCLLGSGILRSGLRRLHHRPELAG